MKVNRADVKIGVIGAGRMGRPIVDRLVAAGYAPTVLTRRPQVRAAAEAAGLSCAGTVQETVRDASVVFTVVLDDEQLRAAVLGEDDVLSSSVVTTRVLCGGTPPSRAVAEHSKAVPGPMKGTG